MCARSYLLQYHDDVRIWRNCLFFSSLRAVGKVSANLMSRSPLPPGVLLMGMPANNTQHAEGKSRGKREGQEEKRDYTISYAVRISQTPGTKYR